MNISRNLKRRRTGVSSDSTTAPPHFTSTSNTSKSSTITSTRTRTRPVIGGNLGSPTTPNFDNPGIILPTSTTSPTPISITSPITTTGIRITVPTPATPTAGSNGGNGDAVNANDGPAGPAITIGKGSLPPGSSGFATSITAPSQATVTGGPFNGPQTPKAKAPISTAFEDPTAQTLSIGDFSTTTTIPISNPPSQTSNTTIQNTHEPHNTLSAGGIAAIIAAICLLVIVFIFLRRRKKAARARQNGIRGTRHSSPRPPEHREFEESALVIAPHSPLDTSSSSTFSVQRSPTRHLDSDYDTLQVASSPPPMMEIDGRARPVPTLVLDTSRYRRNNHSGFVDSSASAVPSISDDFSSRSQAQAHNFPGDTSTISSRTLSPAEAFNASRKAPSTFQDSISSRSSRHTSLKAPPSPRTPTRGSGVFLPPIPPLPKSPPPIPGIQGANPFIDKNPFDDPDG